MKEHKLKQPERTRILVHESDESHEKERQKASFRGTSGRFSVPRYNKDNKKRKRHP